MSNQPLYRWLEQQGEAFGAPGLPAPLDLERQGRRGHRLLGIQPHMVYLLARNTERDLPSHHRPRPGAGHGVPGHRWRDVSPRREARSSFDVRIHSSRGAGGSLYQPRSGRPLFADQGDHLRSAPQRASNPGAAGRPRGPVAAAESLRAAGAAPRRRRRRQLGARGRRGRSQDAAGVEGPVVAGHGRQLRLFARELRVCGLERRLARPERQLPNGLGVRIGDQRQRCGDGRAEPRCMRAPTARASSQWRSASAKASTPPCKKPSAHWSCPTSSIGRGSSSNGIGRPIPSGLPPKPATAES